MKILINFAITIFCISSISACSTIGKLTSKEDKVDDTPAVDITRPPEILVNTKDDAIERDPDETVSYDEWKKQTQADDEE